MDIIGALAQTRKNFYLLMKNRSLNELNAIPAGFNNNLIWNFGHILATQQLLCYGLSNLPMEMPDAQIDAFRKGSKPDRAISEEEYRELLAFSKTSLEQLDRDLKAGIFQEYKDYETSYGIHLTSIQDALSFNALHESMHLGYVMALIRAMDKSE